MDMTLSQNALEHCKNWVKRIIEHPFNQQLVHGTLDTSIFAYYIEQDSYYLRDFAQCLALLAAKAPEVWIKPLLELSQGALLAEQEVVHNHFKKKFSFTPTHQLTPATLGYGHCLLSTCALQPIEIGVAAVLPCFWIYLIVGQSFANTTIHPDNPYVHWINTYAGEDFNQSVEIARAIFDQLATDATASTRDAMLNAFYRSTVFEWHFWNDAYYKKVYDTL